MFSCECCGIFKNTYFEVHLRTVAFGTYSNYNVRNITMTKYRFDYLQKHKFDYEISKTANEIIKIPRIWKKIVSYLQKQANHCVKSVCIWSYSIRIFPVWTEYGDSFRMRETTNQNNPKYGHFSRSEFLSKTNVEHDFRRHNISELVLKYTEYIYETFMQ